MPQITSIEPQKKQKDRFNIFIDGSFAFGIDAEALLKKKLKVGAAINQSDIESITKEGHEQRLMDLALNFLTYRPRSENEVEVYLAKKIAQRENLKFAEAKNSPMILSIVTKLKKYKYISDTEFAKWYVKSRVNSSPRGMRLIKLELQKKGINRDLLSKIHQSGGSELNLAKKAIAKKIDRWKKLPTLLMSKKVYTYLSARGFSYDTTRALIAIYKKKR